MYENNNFSQFHILFNSISNSGNLILYWIGNIGNDTKLLSKKRRSNNALDDASA